MKQTFFTSLCTLVILSSTSGFLHRPIDRLRRSSLVNSEEGVSKFLCYEYENRATDMCTKTVNAEWEHVVDIENKTKAEIAINATIESARLDYDIWINYFRDLDTSKFNSRNLARQVKRLSVLGHSALPEEKLAALTSLQYEMTEIYSTSKICPFANPKCNLQKEGLSYEPDIQNLMATSRDYDELLYTWVAWRETTGNRLKNKFEGYVQLSNEAAIANNFSDKGQMWKYEYESPDIEADLDRLWSEVAPLYKQLHTYVHAKLKVMYEKELESDNDHLIPAHLLGNMWGQTWIHLRDDVKPFPDVPDIDLTEIFAAKNVTVKKMFEMANEFYTSLGLPSMEMAFNTSKGAIIEKPKNKSILCHASAWDFCNGTDFRIKMCAKPTYQDFITIHHELGHIQYYLQYKHLPIAYRAGANPGFHEAIGDTIALSVSTRQHLAAVGLTEAYNDTRQEDINMLMDMALERIAFLPFALLLDKWRWDIFAEKIDPDQWNYHYWNYREKYQGIKSPIPRNDDDFDAGSKFHVASDSQYISYFIAHILEFQIHKALCLANGQYQPDDSRFALHKCDIYKNKEAGRKLSKGLKLGASKHWKYVLREITGESELSALAIVEYFQPLYNYLHEVNNRRE